MKLLVVEDDQGILAGLEYSLTEDGYEAALCGTKAEALEALMKERFDLCLLDLGLPDGSGYTITIWQNSCCLCASCRHYCPTGAMRISTDWHSAHPEEEKFARLEQHTIKYEPCAHCGTLMRPVPAHLAKRLYAKNPDIDPELIRHLCPKCRQIEDAKRNACVLPAHTEDKPEQRVTSAAPTRE